MSGSLNPHAQFTSLQTKLEDQKTSSTKASTRQEDSLYPHRSGLAELQPQQTTAISLSVFHRPVTSHHFHLWKQLLSVPLIPLFFIHDPILSVYNSLLSSARYVASLSYSSFIKRRGKPPLHGLPRRGEGREESCWSDTGWWTSTSGWLWLSRIRNAETDAQNMQKYSYM